MSTDDRHFPAIIAFGLWVLLVHASCGLGDAQGPALCESTCLTANDGVCDDGGAGAAFDNCEYGTDCNDCGERFAGEAPTAPLSVAPVCDNTCPHAHDGVCNDGSGQQSFPLCSPGSDCADCGPREDIQACENDADCGLWHICGLKGRCQEPEFEDHTEHLPLFEREVRAGDLTQAAFELPAGVSSAFVVIEAASSRDGLTLQRVFDPRDRFIFDAEAPENDRIKVFPRESGGQLVIYLHNTPDLTLLAGEYGLQFTTTWPTEVRASVLVKRLPREPRGARLQVNLWFADDTLVDADNAPYDTNFQLALRELRSLYARKRINIHRVTYQNLAEGHARALSVPQGVDSMCANMRDALSETTLPGVNLVIASHFASGGLLGASCGIPGIPSWPGLSRSGVGVAGYLIFEDPQLAGHVMAHEMGHYLGLFHTTELDGMNFDPIHDTPQCTISYDTNFNGILSADECAYRGGGDNTMFWTLPSSDAFTQKKTSPGQRHVLMRNPMVETY
ncbi:hypothetical protein FRC98_02465 [Lujinxingia vulgaris]|uniref:Peptidase M43 pregnancy-associated plasma-A domain-containing protein n=1 Tax=Lujinxingia vulgaris TaxID=2600176 RepID=A0A5C6XFP8_9DELT|nr:hypothetical protein [Lujinxingia vulgaris]TXD39283.1 hypothetical protein FRC98_02465 [Lujinxingia vulgaris]